MAVINNRTQAKPLISPRMAARMKADPRMAMIEELQKSGSSTAPVQSPLEGIARMLQGGLAGYQRGELQREHQTLDNDYRSTMARAIMQGTGASDLPGPTQDGSAGYSVAPDKARMMATLLANPETADAGTELALKSVFTEEMTPYQRESLKIQKARLGQGGSYVDPDTGELIEGTKAKKALPISASKDLLANRSNLEKARTAQTLALGGQVLNPDGTLVNGDKEATGWHNYLPDAIVQRMDPKGIETRAAIGDLGSMVIHDRSGAAVTAAEFPRLKPFIPSATDKPETVQKKVAGFVREYSRIVQEMEDFYDESGYNVPASKQGGGSGGWTIEEVQ